MKISKVLVAAAILIMSSNVFALSKEYRLMGDAPAGSKIRKVDATSPIPFNKSYVEMSEEERALFKKQFKELSVNDRPPFPARGLRAIYRPILKKNRSLGEQGVLKMAISVDENGNVDKVTVINAPSTELEEYAAHIVKDVNFEPATCAGEPCDMDFPVRLVLQ